LYVWQLYHKRRVLFLKYTLRNRINYQQKTINMDREEVKTMVKKVIAKVLEIDESEISDDANFSFDLGATSMQSIRLVAGFQEEFNIEMDEEKSLEIQTVSDAVDFIGTYLT